MNFLRKIVVGIKKFFGGLPEKPEPVRRRWLWIFTIAGVLIVVGLWLALFNHNMGNLAKNSSPTLTPIPSVTIQVQENFGNNFFVTFKTGLAKTRAGFMNFFRPVAESITQFLANSLSTIFGKIKQLGFPNLSPAPN